MIEGHVTYDLVPGVDQEAYVAWAKKTVASILKQPGIIEFRANRNVLGSPQIRTTSVWRSGPDWFSYADGPWKASEAELRRFATNIRVELWGPSVLVPEPLRPGK